ncbi:MAG: carboxypeptidase regulatory-like domain-containing protein [Flavobacteriales bacterium]|nr:carboxypeptidase regulatory-like domain-containing protein [Flavobacteriales bacterium]
MKKLVVFFWVVSPLFMVQNAFGQSISGNVKSTFEDESLSFANVDIYLGDSLVANVLTDIDGNFNVKLKPGTYRCEIKYASHDVLTKTIKVEKDETMNAELNAKEEYKKGWSFGENSGGKDMSDSEVISRDIYSYSAKRSKGRSPKMAKTSMDYDADYDGRAYESAYETIAVSPAAGILGESRLPMKGDMYGYNNIAEAGKLTAGEINDFSKWTLWTDLTENELEQHKNLWKINPSGRFSVQVTNQNSLPVANVVAKLIDEKGTTVFQSKTDNTGKVELWGSLLGSISGNFQVLVEHNGKTTKQKVHSFEKGVNFVKLNSECSQSEAVDIAFVVDATGSMGDEIEFLKKEISQVIFQSKQISSTLNFQFANVFYRDVNDEYVTRTQDFTRVLSEANLFISNQTAGGGGDYEEAVEMALDTAINYLNWREEARTRILFLVLDAPPHNNPEIQEKLRKLGEEAAKKGIRIVPLVASGINKSAEYLFRSLALTTNGTYVFLTDHSGIGDSHIAPSTDSYEVELLQNLMVRLIKSYTYMPDCNQQIPELNLHYNDSTIIVNQITQDSTINGSGSLQAGQKTDTLNIVWSFYPNPTTGLVYVKSNQLIKELYVTDLTGKVLQIHKDINNESPLEIDLSSYASGVYLIRYPLGKQWVSGKVVLAR